MNATATQRGFDAAALTQADDHLGRWPLAKEIYGIAITGPVEWSVRIGVYGEWGTGKTSVLNFIGGMARKDGHIIVPFNPWEYGSREGMWRAFVVTIYRALEEEFGQVRGASWKKAKEWTKKITDVIGNVVSGGAEVVGAGKAVDAGLDLLKKHLVFSANDLNDFRDLLGEKRVLVLIDDLDRTKPDLVPEMLFALKEIMDVPGFVFICAFDPVVVGEVLGQYHPGFGDGLKFLEKIIDYPRWLPPPSAEGMQVLAHSDVARYCPYVPLAAMNDVVHFLPQNPRVLRQFIRLLALIKPQIDRHYEGELGWSTILSANVLKVLYPRIAQEFFSDESVWADIAGARIMGAVDKKAEDKIGKLLSARLDKAVGRLGIDLKANDHERILDVLRRLANVSDVWLADYRSLAYQIHIAEAPQAVTWKEYEEFRAVWTLNPDAGCIEAWMTKHAGKEGRRVDDVYLEVVDATLRSRDGLLSRAADVAINSEMVPLLQQANGQLTLLEQLVFNLGGHSSATKRFGEDQIKHIIESLFKYAAWNGKKEYRAMRARERSVLRRFITDWVGDVTPLMNVLKPFSDMPEVMIGKEGAALRKELRALILPRFAEQVLQGLSKQGYVERVVGRGEGSYDIGCVLLDAGGSLWKGLRTELNALFSQAGENVNVQMNAVEMVHWFDYKMRAEAGFSETKAIERLLRTSWASRQLWNAATAKPLNPRHVGQLRDFPERVKKLGIVLRLPHWWRRALRELGIETKRAKAAAEQKASAT